MPHRFGFPLKDQSQHTLTVGLIRLRDCCLFVSRRYPNGQRRVVLSTTHCDLCVQELRRAEPEIILDRPSAANDGVSPPRR